MLTLDMPLHRRPIWQHAIAGLGLLAAVCGVCWWILATYQQRASEALVQLHQNQRLLQDLQSRKGAQPPKDFTTQLPVASVAADVEHDTARFAQMNGVQVVSLTVQRQAGTARELATTQLSVAAVADYAQMKGWLKELLDRYPSLAMTSLTMRPLAGNGTRLEATVMLTLFTKD